MRATPKRGLVVRKGIAANLLVQAIQRHVVVEPVRLVGAGSLQGSLGLARSECTRHAGEHDYESDRHLGEHDHSSSGLPVAPLWCWRLLPLNGAARNQP